MVHVATQPPAVWVVGDVVEYTHRRARCEGVLLGIIHHEIGKSFTAWLWLADHQRCDPVPLSQLPKHVKALSDAEVSQAFHAARNAQSPRVAPLPARPAADAPQLRPKQRQPRQASSRCAFLILSCRI